MHDNFVRHGAVLLIWHDVAPDSSTAVHEWYTLEHHQERLAIEGFKSAARWHRLSGNTGDFLGLYELTDASVLRGAAYIRRLSEPSPWTRSVMPSFRKMHRTPGEVAFWQRRGRGGYLALAAGMRKEHTPSFDMTTLVAALPQALALWLVVAESGNTASALRPTSESALRDGQDDSVAWAVLAETATVRDCEGLSARLLGLLPEAEFQGTYENVFYAARNIDRDDH